MVKQIKQQQFERILNKNHIRKVKMYKQCFELLTAQGPKPHKSFSVAHGTGGEVTKEFDAEIKGNIFSLAGQRIQLPPNPSHQTTDFHNTGSGATKKVGVTSSLNIVHQFLVFQVFVPTGEPFQIELHVRDKHNARRRLMICDGTKSIVTNQMHVRIPNGQIRRDCWTNLCLDVNSFIRECFAMGTSRVNAAPYGTPVTQASQVIQSKRDQSQGPVGGGSGDIAALHREQAQAISGTNQISKVASMLHTKNAANNGTNSNSMKTIEVIQLEGNFKIRKIFTSRSQIPADSLETNPFGTISNAGATALSGGGTMRPEDIIQAAMVGQRIEQIPKNFDYAPHVERFSQVLSYEQVSGFISDQQQHLRQSNSVEDSMMVTGLRMTQGTQNSGGFNQSDQNETNYSLQKHNNQIGIGVVQQYQAGFLQPGSVKHQPGGSNSGLKSTKSGAFRVGSNDRKSSIGGDSNSPYPQGGLIGQTLSPNSMVDGSFRLGANLSKQTQNSVVVVDEEANEQMQARQDSQNRRSGVSGRQRQQNAQGFLHPKNNSNNAVTNTTGDTSIFKQANSTASNHGQRSNQTQSTAYSVRTTSSGRQQKGKKFGGAGASGHQQSSQSPITDNSGGGAGGAFSYKRSNNALSNDRPVYEQVDEMEESGSGQISLKLEEKQQTTKQATSKNFQINSPRQTTNNTQSAKIKRKGIPKTNLAFDASSNHTQASEKFSQMNQPQQQMQDPMTTPKLHHLQEVHQTTIMEENETLRGSMDRHPGSKMGLHNNLASNNSSNAKKFNRVVQQIDQKKANAANQSAAGTRKNANVPATGPTSKNSNARTKSSVGPKEQPHSTINNQSSAQHPLVRGKNQKVSQSSQNLDESIGGIVGNKIQNNRNTGGRKQQLMNNQNNPISPNVARQSNIPKNKLQLSGQRKQRSAAHQSEAPQFQVRGGGSMVNTAGKKQLNHQNSNGAAQFLYNGSGYGSQAQNHLDSDGEQSDFKTTTLRFTNNNFINTDNHRRENQNRDSSQGAPARDNNGNNNSMALLNTLNSQTGKQIAEQSSYRRNSKQFGTSDNFKVTAYHNNRESSYYDQRTDGFSRLNNQSKSPVNLNRQFSTMQGRMQQSDQGYNDEEEEEEMIEEDICDQNQSPPIKDKQQTGQKAKALFQGQLQQQPVPAFRSTESENFNMDAMTTGFAAKMNLKIGATSPYAGIGGMKDATPLHDKSSILATKPQIGGTKGRHQLVKSPDSRSYNMGYGQIDSEMRHNQYGIEEEIDNVYESNNGGNMNIEESPKKPDPNDTCTSDFYQVPIQGGIPVQLTIENGRRPFTPPFAQLIKKGKPPTAQSGSRASNRPPPQQESPFKQPPLPVKQPPEWVKPAIQVSKPKILMTDSKGMVKASAAPTHAYGSEEVIEEEIEGVNHESTTTTKVQKQEAKSTTDPSSTTETGKQATSSEAGSRNARQQDHFHTFAEEPIEYTESFKRHEGVIQGNSASMSSNKAGAAIQDPTGSASQTFGRQSQIQSDSKKQEAEADGDDDEELDREATFAANNEEKQLEQSYLQRDVIDSQIIDQKKQRLLYDKSLKAYYDPETGQYFEMKAQLINQSSLSQFQSASKD